ncbi:MAG: rRNA maturation RNase YbeY [Minisyncoccota bacterium]
MSVEIKKTIRGSAPKLPFEDLARAVLGPSYQLSLVLCGDKLAQRINVAYRKKSYYPNVLSFELDAKEGEIFLNVRKAEREARQYGVTAKQRIALLYVHGLFHLKGLAHGDAMENAELKVLKKFGLQ